MNDTIIAHILQLSEGGGEGLLTGADPALYKGALFSRLLNAGVLLEQAPLSDWAVCDGCTCGLDWRVLDDDGAQYRARCPLDHKRDAILGADDLRSFAIDMTALAWVVCEAAGLDGKVEEVARGVWRLGSLSPRRALAVCFARHAIDDPDLPVFLGGLGEAYVTLLGPRPLPVNLRALRPAGIDVVGFDAAITIGPGEGITLNRHRLDPTEDARLIVDRSTRQVVIDGQPQKISAQPFRLLSMLATAAVDGNGNVSMFDIEHDFSRRPNDLVRDLRNALSRGRDNAAEIRNWVVSARGNASYRLSLASEDIELRA